MIRRRSTPWLHRYSRPLIGGIAIVGATLTAYLTITKLTGGTTVCVEGGGGFGCSGVLNSAYATVFGLPLSLFGCLAYLWMAFFSLSPLFLNGESQKNRRKAWENTTWPFLLVGATSMAVFSGYLMFILFTELKEFCPYCITSALFSLSMLTLTVLGREWEGIGQILFPAIVVAMITLVATLAIYSGVNTPATAGGKVEFSRPMTAASPPNGWEVTTTSGESEIALAKHLKAIGAKEYGAFWCPHCYDQKQLFGKEANEILKKESVYTECDPQGANPNPKACTAAGVKGFPTWVIKGQTVSGTQSLEKLAELSGYKGPKDFKYKMPGRG
ncbi:vitamin K epoxide reductase family protein [Pannus brasiliensis CCIBt3594]|uniref:Vitamin K epoxide reductase family protein n=1 Tax=Pannus brasiliensis CCIBt3594 TaxID=1427578 RepID=A0AAW9QVF0_9CHRO